MTLESAIPSAQTEHIHDASEDNSLESVLSHPAQLDLQVSTSTSRCTVRWGLANQNKYLQHTVRVYIYYKISPNQVINGRENLCLLTTETFPFASLEVTWTASPGHVYYAYVEVQDQHEQQKVIACGDIRVRACFSKSEQQELYNRAATYSGSAMIIITEIYRCKPYDYWQDIFNNHNGTMKPYLKDENGHAANHINSTLSGLFFSAQLNSDGTERIKSVFGNTKYSLTPAELFDPKMVNFYFCDFYCTYTLHYITVVVCKKGSTSDTFCALHLIPLPSDNPFFQVKTLSGGLQYYLNRNVCVEFLYTENIPLKKEKLKPIIPLNRGCSKKNGLPNNKTCSICNISPTIKY